MARFLKLVMAAQIVGLISVTASAQVGNCPSRPVPGTPISNPLDLYSQNGPQRRIGL